MGNGGKTRQDRNVWGPVQIWPSGLMEFLFQEKKDKKTEEFSPLQWEKTKIIIIN